MYKLAYLCYVINMLIYVQFINILIEALLRFIVLNQLSLVLFSNYS